nr:MAG TPA: hypothetical protein [Caudoviricetes sp.]
MEQVLEEVIYLLMVLFIQQWMDLLLYLIYMKKLQEVLLLNSSKQMGV